MNENPAGTPNPLNPAPVAPMPGADAPSPAPTVPMQESVVSVQDPVTPAHEPATPIPTPVQEPIATVQEPAALNPKPVVPEPVKKSRKTPIIIVVIILLLAAIGCGVAAIVILKPFGGADAVPAAISKLMNGAPKYVTADGTIAAKSDSLVPELSVAFKASVDGTNNQSYADAVVTADLGMDDNFKFSAEEIHTADGNLYLKLNGITDALEVFGGGEIEETDCIDDPTGLTDCNNQIVSPVMGAIGLLEVIDDEWIQIPDSTFSNITSVVSLDSTTQCLVSAAGKLGQYGDDFANLYNANQFMNYSTDGITIAKKRDTIYKLSFDAEKLAGFINAMGNSGFMNELNACMGATATNVKVDADSLAEILAAIPAIYVEINDDNDFTRVYLSTEIEGTTVVVDISFSYPNSITVEEPEYYIDFNYLLSQILNDFFNTDISDQKWVNCQPPLSDAEAEICEEAEASGYTYIAY